VPIIVADIEGCHGPEYQKDASSVGRDITIGFFS
jgi:hypothetical protein